MPSVFIKTYGCQMNERDSEAVAAQLLARGYTLSPSEHEADVVILCDFSGLGSLFTVSDLYVALTRARSHLIIVAHDRAAKESLDAALAAAIATGSDE